jgi:hypothetical protein
MLRVLEAVLSAPDLLPVKRGQRLSGKRYCEWWVDKYVDGWNDRVSSRGPIAVSTIPDPAVSVIAEVREGLTVAECEAWVMNHRNAMSFENAVGGLLEEFLAFTLIQHDWHCAWGSTIKSADFVGPGRRFLQVKNRSNTENSSSKAVRQGTPIEMWYRLEARTGSSCWHDLRTLLRTGPVQDLSEQAFLQFVRRATSRN